MMQVYMYSNCTGTRSVTVPRMYSRMTAGSTHTARSSDNNPYYYTELLSPSESLRQIGKLPVW